MTNIDVPDTTDRDGFTCPVCGFDGLLEPAYDVAGKPSHEICPCCGFEFGFDDLQHGISHEEYRARWIAEGAAWFAPDEQPDDWDLSDQLRNVA